MKNNIIILVIIVLATALRFYQFGEVPASLNPDEAALGYNAYSILHTGADEHGKYFPLSLESFGDWKLPIYSYLDAIPIALFGVSNISVRLPSVIAGIVSIILIYLLVFRIFKNRTVAFLSSLFLAFNPWSIFFSSGAYEVNVATTIFIGGVLLFTFFISTKKILYLISSFTLFGITMFTQHNYIVFSPLFVFIILFLYRKKYSLNQNFIFSAVYFIALILFSYLSLYQGGDKKISNLNVFNNKDVIYNRAEILRGDGANSNKIIEKVLFNKYSAGIYQLAQNYLSAFSSSVLFDKGGERLTHNIGKVGYFYVLDSLFFLVGISFMFWKKEKGSLLILLPWLLLAPIPSAVTNEHTGTRLFTILPPFIIIASYGAYIIITFLRTNKLRLTILALLIFSYVVSVVYFLEYYFVHFNIQRLRFWRYGMMQIVEVSQKYPEYRVVMRGPENFPYIYFLLYLKYDPMKFRREVEYFPTTKDGFRYVKKFGNYLFVNEMDYNEKNPKTIYIDDNPEQNLFTNSITLPNKDIIYKYEVID